MNLGLLALLSRSAPPAMPVEAKAEHLNAHASAHAAEGAGNGQSGNGQPFEQWVKHYAAEGAAVPQTKPAMDATTLVQANVPAADAAALMQMAQMNVGAQTVMVTEETELAMLEPMPVEAMAMLDANLAISDATPTEAQALAALSAGPAMVSAVEDEEEVPQQNPLAPTAVLSEAVQAMDAVAAPTPEVQVAALQEQPADALDALSISQDHADEAVVALPVMPGMVPATPDETALQVAAVTAQTVPVAGPALAPAPAMPQVPQLPDAQAATPDDALVALQSAQNPQPAQVAQQVQQALEQTKHQGAMHATGLERAVQVASPVAQPKLAAKLEARADVDTGVEMPEIEAEAPEMDDGELEAVVARLLQQGRGEMRDNGPANLNVSPQHYNATPSQPINLVGAQAEFVAAPEAAAMVDDGLSVAATAPHGASAQHDAVQRLGAAMSQAKGEHFASSAHQGAPSEQVQVSIRRAMSMGVDRVTVQLQPEELGRVEVRMDVGVDGRSTVVFNVDNRDTLDLLQRDAKQLERVLQESGINANAGDMQFNLQQRQSQDEGEGSTGGRYVQAAAATETEAYVDATTGHYTVTVSNGVDIRV